MSTFFIKKSPIGECTTQKYTETHSPYNTSCQKYSKHLMLHVAVHTIATRRKTVH